MRQAAMLSDSVCRRERQAPSRAREGRRERIQFAPQCTNDGGAVHFAHSRRIQANSDCRCATARPLVAWQRSSARGIAGADARVAHTHAAGQEVLCIGHTRQNRETSCTRNGCDGDGCGWNEWIRASGVGCLVCDTRCRRQRDGECLYPATRTIDALRGADVVVVAVPDTPETRGIIGEEEIQAMHGGSETKQCVLVNVGRGVCCDGDAVHRALESGELFAFASDVWYTYPKSWDEAADCPPETPSGLSFATGVAGSKSTLSSHRGGSPGQSETEMRRIGAMAAAFNYAASAGDAAALASGPDSLIGRVSLAKGF